MQDTRARLPFSVDQENYSKVYLDENLNLEATFGLTD